MTCNLHVGIYLSVFDSISFYVVVLSPRCHTSTAALSLSSVQAPVLAPQSVPWPPAGVELYN